MTNSSVGFSQFYQIQQILDRFLNEKGYNGKEIVFGVRPEDIHSDQAFIDTWPDAIVEAEVSVSELLEPV